MKHEDIIWCTGHRHGHISRARVILPRLREIAQVDVLISGYNFKLHLDGEITYKARGISLAYDRKGSVDVLETALNIQPVKTPSRHSFLTR